MSGVGKIPNRPRALIRNFGDSRDMKLLTVFLAIALAGCIAPGGDGETRPSNDVPGPGAQNAEDATADLSLLGAFKPCPSGYCLNLTAANEGQETYYVETGCSIPFKDRLEERGQPVQHREPVASCLGFGTTEFAAGAQLEHQFTWDGRLWDGGDYYMASGSMRWTGEFVAYTKELGEGERVVLSVEFTFPVGSI